MNYEDTNFFKKTILSEHSTIILKIGQINLKNFNINFINVLAGRY